MELPPTAVGNGEFDACATLTCKFSKRILVEPGKTNWSAENWAIVLITSLISHDWGIPQAIISDRDAKFMSEFWKTVFQKLNTRLLTSTSYHPQTDGQSERTNQVLEIALRFFLTSHPEKDWTAVIPVFQGGINNISNASTGHSPNEIVYRFRVRDTLNSLLDLPQDLRLFRSIMRQEASDSISFANVVMKQRYDQKHKPIQMEVGSYAYLRLHKGYTIPGLRNRKLSPQRVEPFLIKRKVGELAYELQIAPVMRIHPVISVAQLEPAPKDPDPFSRIRPTEPPPVVEGGDVFEVERVLGKRVSRKKIQYLVKWFGYC